MVKDEGNKSLIFFSYEGKAYKYEKRFIDAAAAKSTVMLQHPQDWFFSLCKYCNFFNFVVFWAIHQVKIFDTKFFNSLTISVLWFKSHKLKIIFKYCIV